MTGAPWQDLEDSTIRLGNMHTALQIAMEQLGTSDLMVVDLLGLVRDSLGTEIGTIEKIWDGMRREGCQQASPRVVKS